jgi:hypothetical protein
MELKKETIASLPLCKTGLNRFVSLRLPRVFTAREAVTAYLAAGGYVSQVALAYGAMVSSGLAPERGAIWQISRLAFAVQDEESGLKVWAGILGPGNWKEAKAAAAARYARAVEAAYYAAHATATYCAAAAAFAARDAAHAAYTYAFARARYARAAGLSIAAEAAAYAATLSPAYTSGEARNAQEAKIAAVILAALGE